VDDKKQIWLTLSREKYPSLNEDQLAVLSLEAANGWYMGEESELTNLFDQYVMLKNLKDM
jgi:hypothetical protein